MNGIFTYRDGDYINISFGGDVVVAIHKDDIDEFIATIKQTANNETKG